MDTNQIEDRIRKAYPSCRVNVVDTTGTLDHFQIQVSTPEFASLSRIRQHQAILDLFREELKTGEIHAFEIKILNSK